MPIHVQLRLHLDLLLCIAWVPEVENRGAAGRVFSDGQDVMFASDLLALHDNLELPLFLPGFPAGTNKHGKGDKPQNPV